MGETDNKATESEKDIDYWLKFFDWEIRIDYEGPKETRPVFFIHESEDPSVGMFGMQISPQFKRIADLGQWLTNLMDNYDIKIK